MEKINWGIIGCGDVAEIKSGPAFQKAANSTLLAVMRRDGIKAKDFAERHQVPQWSDDADDLLQNDQINAIYIATPPSTHLDYTVKALNAGKHVYLEKPMALSSLEARSICESVALSKNKLTLAHYRRMLPAFLKVKQLIDKNAIGKVLLADVQILQPQKSNIIADTEESWRLDPNISGGGYFYDIGPHQIDLMRYFFGAFARIEGLSGTAGSEPLVEDIVNGIMDFENGIQFRGVWNFNASPTSQKDECVIYGTEGKLTFSFFGETVHLLDTNGKEVFTFENPKHIQQPMIETVVSYFMGRGDNPCTAEDGLVVMDALERLSGRSPVKR